MRKRFHWSVPFRVGARQVPARDRRTLRGQRVFWGLGEDGRWRRV